MNQRPIATKRGELANFIARANSVKVLSQMDAKQAAGALQTCAGLPMTEGYDPLAHRRTRSHVKLSSRERRQRKIAAGKLAVVNGELVGA